MNNIFVIYDNIQKLFDKIDVDKKGYIIGGDMNTFNTGLFKIVHIVIIIV